MYGSVGDVRLFFEVEGGKLVPEGSTLRERPTLVMSGEDDPITPIGDSEDIVAALPPGLARFERFTGAGHGVYRDAPERAFSLLRDFVCAPA
jgi:pimeloyl-ACP methyl ester carboxylesterase